MPRKVSEVLTSSSPKYRRTRRSRDDDSDDYDEPEAPKPRSKRRKPRQSGRKSRRRSATSSATASSTPQVLRKPAKTRGRRRSGSVRLASSPLVTRATMDAIKDGDVVGAAVGLVDKMSTKAVKRYEGDPTPALAGTVAAMLGLHYAIKKWEQHAEKQKTDAASTAKMAYKEGGTTSETKGSGRIAEKIALHYFSLLGELTFGGFRRNKPWLYGCATRDVIPGLNEIETPAMANAVIRRLAVAAIRGADRNGDWHVFSLELLYGIKTDDEGWVVSVSKDNGDPDYAVADWTVVNRTAATVYPTVQNILAMLDCSTKDRSVLVKLHRAAADKKQ